MKELYKEVCDYITSHNGVGDNLYNGILLEVYEEYAYNYLENETNEENNGNKTTLQDLEEIADDIINNEYFGEILTDIIRTTTTNFLGE